MSQFWTKFCNSQICFLVSKLNEDNTIFFSEEIKSTSPQELFQSAKSLVGYARKTHHLTDLTD